MVFINRQLVFPVVFGALGVILLCGLGTWQIQRLEWKNKILDNIEQKIVAKPIKLPENLKEQTDQYLSVSVTGEVQFNELHVLTSLKNIGPGFLVISPLKLRDGRLIMIDRGFIPENEKNVMRMPGKIEVIGNLLWPNEIDGFTPDPNIKKNIWFGRDLIRMSEYLGTLPILVVARKTSFSDQTSPQRVGVNIANNHLSYAVTWFSLACVWFGMTILLVYRIKKYKL
tara:strand:+ start:280 stop:960 length:681 start_codon:yes stop_codon:yes gene_type:complete